MSINPFLSHSLVMQIVKYLYLLSKCPIAAGLVKEDRFNEWTHKEDIHRTKYLICSHHPKQKDHEREDCKCTGFYKTGDHKTEEGTADVPIHFAGQEECACHATINEHDLLEFGKARDEIRESIKKYFEPILYREHVVEHKNEPEEESTKL